MLEGRTKALGDAGGYCGRYHQRSANPVNKRMTVEHLHSRVRNATKVLTSVQRAIADLQIVIDARTATTIPLVLGSFDMADAAFTLLLTRHQRTWVSCLALQRSQLEYVVRAAFFAKAASERELKRFRRSGELLRRGERTIWIGKVAEEAAQHLGWEEERLVATVRAHQKDLSSAVHGGREVLRIYTMNEEWGDIEVDWAELTVHVDNIVVFLMLGLAVAAHHSQLTRMGLDEVLRPAYMAGTKYFSGPQQ